MSKNRMRKIRPVVTAMTARNLQKLADMEGVPVGRIIDKLTRDRMVQLHPMFPEHRKERKCD